MNMVISYNVPTHGKCFTSFINCMKQYAHKNALQEVNHVYVSPLRLAEIKPLRSQYWSEGISNLFVQLSALKMSSGSRRIASHRPVMNGPHFHRNSLSIQRNDYFVPNLFRLCEIYEMDQIFVADTRS